MPGKPSVLYQWAVANLFASGPATGTPTRVAPTSGAGSQQDQGVVPGSGLGAQLLNALFGNVFDALAYLFSNQIDGSLVIGGASVTIAPFTFTATSGTPGSLTATAHGLQTGDGPVRVSNSGGGLPGGLAAGTDYRVIVVDANTLRLAVDRTNTLRATPIPVVITSNGTGTQTLSPGTSPTRLGDLTVTRTLAVNGTAQTAHKLKVGGMSLVFPSFAFTASSATDKLTFADHGLKTGDGPVQVSNSGGALPTGLAPSTDYWVITVDTSNIELATTYANAIAGVAIDLTSNGSGTNTLAATASTVAPADAEVTGTLTIGASAVVGTSLAVGGDVYGVRTRQVIPAAWIASGTAPTLVANPSGSPIQVWKLPTAQTVRARIPYEIGETVTAVKFEVYGDGAVNWTGAIKWNANSDGTGGGTVASNAGVTAQAATWTMSSLTIGGIGALTSGGDLYVEVVISSGTQLYLGSVEIAVKRLP